MTVLFLIVLFVLSTVVGIEANAINWVALIGVGIACYAFDSILFGHLSKIRSAIEYAAREISWRDRD